MGLGFSGGVAATYGKGYLANRFAPNISAVDSLPKPEVPTDFEKLNLWNDGDSLSTSVSKSIAINAGLSVMSGIIASTSVVGTLSTSWNVGISKLKSSGKEALVKLIWAKEKGAKAAFNAGNFVANFSLTKAWGKSESFSYIFDLTSPTRLDIPPSSSKTSAAAISAPARSKTSKSASCASRSVPGASCPRVFSCVFGIKESGIIESGIWNRRNLEIQNQDS